ncbi:MAG TPA: dihydrofolate reductase [Cyanobacteria bacterium UBA8803]|nr:dihydrofolate reductase [Cyanobacteria bacterium UBA9273]HBL60318.1 dihydrofolate reductase [Cyanobacteria bacterium UBA8803]
MVDIIYYLATSLDGYIATQDDGIEWLPPIEKEGEDYGYSEFYNSVDAIIMGRRTYEKSLELGEWFYSGKPCWVCTQRQIQVQQPDVIVTSSSPIDIITELEKRDLQRVWLVGGGKLASSFRNYGLISEYQISIIPIILGKGIPLFDSPGQLEKLKLVECKPFPNGVVMLRYLRDG